MVPEMTDVMSASGARTSGRAYLSTTCDEGTYDNTRYSAFNLLDQTISYSVNLRFPSLLSPFVFVFFLLEDIHHFHYACSWVKCVHTPFSLIVLQLVAATQHSIWCQWPRTQMPLSVMIITAMRTRCAVWHALRLIFKKQIQGTILFLLIHAQFLLNPPPSP